MKIWKLPTIKTFNNNKWIIGQFHMDCAFKSGALHVWQQGARFKVGIALSNITVEMFHN